jgi:hypothetical protein
MRSAGRIWFAWLMAATIGTGLFGLAFLVLPEAMVRFFDVIVLSGTGIDARFGAEAGAYLRFTNGVLGAVMVGWAISLAGWLLGPFRRGERLGWVAVTASIVVWYALDTPFSLLSGYAGNAVLNTAFLIAFAVPLAATARQFLTRAK